MTEREQLVKEASDIADMLYMLNMPDKANAIRRLLSLLPKEGWASVPKDITPQMLIAFQHASGLHPPHKQIVDGYKAMIEARPR